METITLKPGDVITYVGQDAGGLLFWDDAAGQRQGWSLKPTYAHLEGRASDEPEEIVVDTDIPLALCQSLVDSGRCAVVGGRSVAPSPVSKARRNSPAVADAPIVEVDPVETAKVEEPSTS